MHAITKEDAMEMVSACLVGLHSARARLNIKTARFDRDSADLELEYVDNGALPTQFVSSSMKVQLKCVHKLKLKPGAAFFDYDLKSKNYNDLAKRGQIRHILVIALLNQDIDSSLSYHNPNAVDACLYWIELRGKKPTTNKNTVRIQIPVTNTFDHRIAARLLREVQQRIWVA